ncbi:MAG: menaquinone biosynthesis protein [Acidimicrobiia bacterium]|nr:menaquinone biosynthesis protein [Acidimicrobiia bacterium]
MSVVRLGAVEYLNARPLAFRLDRSPRFDVRFDWPSRCATLLHDGVIDLGLIPSIEYLRAPQSAQGERAYRIVPDLAVASRGPVASVAIFTTKPIGDVRSIALDTSSRTSVALTRVLCSHAFGIIPELRQHGPDLPAMLLVNDAALLIGDRALLIESGPLRIGDHEVMVEKIDLGERWLRATGLPFVYAFWAGRGGAITDEDVRVLQAARDEALTDLETVSAEYFGDEPALVSLGVRYLRDNIHYSLGEDERAGLTLFYRYAVEVGAVDASDALRFF